MEKKSSIDSSKKGKKFFQKNAYPTNTSGGWGFRKKEKKKCKLTCESTGKARAAAHAPFSVFSSRTVLIQIDAAAEWGHCQVSSITRVFHFNGHPHRDTHTHTLQVYFKSRDAIIHFFGWKVLSAGAVRRDAISIGLH